MCVANSFDDFTESSFWSMLNAVTEFIALGVKLIATSE